MNGVATAGGGRVERRAQGDLAQVVELILDKGLVIDVWAKISIIGLELITIQARIVVASVDTYLRYAEAVGRLEQSSGDSGIEKLLGGGGGSGSGQKKPGRKREIAAGVLEGGKEWLQELREERRSQKEESR
ncbi:gas vesicle protein GvpA/GvpJ/GvpM family [Pseudonocardia endophytica]|uniref:Gas vesicle protein A n=1 Tax=Pseudonocardia endophytica TaxID=401976 RepID=A0A4R1HWZ3_PSEEN|nr:gas vesicle protein GvpA/GvpJ/GvpM family [Pseudonocardia endophytica]